MCSLEMWSLQILTMIVMVDYADSSERGLPTILVSFFLTTSFVLYMYDQVSVLYSRCLGLYNRCFV